MALARSPIRTDQRLYLAYANVAKLADAQDLGSCPARGAGSTPAVRTRSDSTITPGAIYREVREQS